MAGAAALTTAGTGGGGPGAEQATQVAQSWAAAINAGDATAAQQYLCAANRDKSGGSTGVTLTLTGLSATGPDTATADFQVQAQGQTGTAQVAMRVENSAWTMCQQG